MAAPGQGRAAAARPGGRWSSTTRPRAPSARRTPRRRSSSRRRPGRPPARCRPRPGRKTIPASQIWSRIASRSGVAEVLRDRGGEHVRRLVAVEPGRDPQRLPASPTRRRARSSAGAPTRRPTGGTTGPPTARPTPRPGGRGTCRRGGHRGWPPPSPRAAPGRDDVRRWPSIQPSRAASAYAAEERSRACAAHHADQVSAGDPGRQRLVDRVVVQGLDQGRRGASAAPATRRGRARRGSRRTARCRTARSAV